MKKALFVAMYSVVAFGTGFAQDKTGSAADPMLMLPDAKAHHITLFDPRTKTAVAVIPVAGWPHELAFSADGKLAYAPSYSNQIVGVPGLDGQTIEVIDMDARKVVQTWDLGKAVRPHRALLAKDGTLYVSTELNQSVTLIDTATGKVKGEITTGAKTSHMLQMTADEGKMYTANLKAGSVSVLDLKARKLVKMIPVSELIQRIWLSADGKSLFVTDGKAAQVVVIDTATDTISRKIPLGNVPFMAYATPDGRWLLAGEDGPAGGRLEVVDLKDFAVKKSFDVDAKPYGIRVVGDEAFVACIISGNLDVLDMKRWVMEPPVAGISHGDGIAVWSGR